MLAFALRRLGVLAFTLLVVSVLAFAVPYVGKGDPARTILQSRTADAAPDPAAVEALRSELGLDQSLPVQYWRWLTSAVTGDFGLSFTSRTPVSELVVNALGVSVTLAAAALIVALVVAIPLGTVAALRPGKAVDNAITFVTQALVAVPEYWLAPVSILAFALWLGWLPSAGWEGPTSIVLPAFVLALRPMAYFTRVTRAAMIDVLGAPYITASRARGLGLLRTLERHAVRNSMLPVMTLFSIWMAGLIGGSVVVEVIFAVPGMGRLVYEAVVNGDIPVIQAGIVTIVAFTVLINTVTDFAYAFLNPAVRVTDGRA